MTANEICDHYLELLGFGKIPLNPGLSSSLNQIPKIKQRYRELLDTWAQWWAWEPHKGEE